MDTKTIQEIDKSARAKFTYKTDGKFDTWRSHADDVLADESWKGDCDDLASTVLDLLGRKGLELQERARCCVSSRGSFREIDHMVAAVLADDGNWWVVGDTFSPAYPAGHMMHVGIVYNLLSEAGDKPVWRDGVPWQR